MIKNILYTVLISCLLTNAISLNARVLTYTNYRSNNQVKAALETLHSNYPTMTSVTSIGKSIEGRDIWALKISKNPAVDDPKKGDVIYVGLHHAREWVTVEVCLFIADEMLANYSTNTQLKADMDATQIWIIPVVNPDGYVYTWSADRYWRKNRRSNSDGSSGVDLNRNWGYQWGLSSGSSSTMSDDTYRGTAPFSEPEVNHLKNFINARKNLKCLITYHSYSELFLRPWSYTTADPPGKSTLASIAKRNIARIAAVHGHTYSETIWYTSSGETTDYLWGEKRVAAFTPELMPTSSAGGGFALPPAEILPTAEENYAAATAMLHDAAISHIYIRDHNSDNGTEPSATWTGTHWTHAFWVSPDIWTVPAEPTEGSTVNLYVRVHNTTGKTQSKVTIDAYYNDPRISLEFPNPNSKLIGSKVVSLPPGQTTLTYSWKVPMGTNIWGERHWCVGVVIKHENDMPLTNVVNRTSNIGCKNFNTKELTLGGSLMIAANNFLLVPAELIFNFDPEKIPQNVSVKISEKPVRRTMKPDSCSLRKAGLLKTKGIILEPGEDMLFTIDVNVTGPITEEISFPLNISGALKPLVAGKREVLGNGYSYEVKIKP